MDYDGDVRFKVVNHSVNRGASSARNSGILASEGDYIMFVDSDDYLKKGALQSMIRDINEVDNPEGVDVVVGNTYVCKDDGLTMKKELGNSLWIDNTGRKALRMLLSREIIHLVCNKLIRRDFLINNCLYFEEDIIDEDLLWSYLIFSQAKSVILMSYVTYTYCNNPQSVTNTPEKRVVKIINSRMIICEKILFQSSVGKDMIEYYVYLFFILLRAVDLYEKHRDVAAGLSDRLDRLRKAFLKEIWEKGYYLSFFFFLPIIKPYYYITCFKWYRRYCDRINKIALSLNHSI
jgi:glycosyltransferase involved in cell wall biosynthesis